MPIRSHYKSSANKDIENATDATRVINNNMAMLDYDGTKTPNGGNVLSKKSYSPTPEAQGYELPDDEELDSDEPVNAFVPEVSNNEYSPSKNLTEFTE